MSPSILFIAKAHNFYCDQAMDFIKLHFPQHRILRGKRNEVFPDLRWWQGDYILSYLSPWIIPEYLLSKAKVKINFHPGPPEYPGTGCYNFAIYNQETIYGVTCHHMEPKVDTGKLIAVKRFALYESDTVFSLSQRCYSYILSLFYDVMSAILEGYELPSVDETWKRKPYTRRQLNDLCKITTDMSDGEIRRRVKAVTFPNAPGAYIEMAGVRFEKGPEEGR